MFCREQVAQLRPFMNDIHARNAELWAISTGAPAFISGFRETTGFTGPVLIDPTLASYRAAKLKRAGLGLLSPRTAIDAARALRAGHRQGATQGDPWQLGGVLVVAPDDALRFHFEASRAGELVDIGAVLAALP